MSNRALSVPGITVNNGPYPIVPNSFKYKLGQGEVNVRSASTGNGSTESVHTENAEDKVGMVSFDLFVNDENKDAAFGWKQAIGGNVVQAQQTGQKPIVLNGASMTNDPDWEGSADGTVTIEFKGDPISAT